MTGFPIDGAGHPEADCQNVSRREVAFVDHIAHASGDSLDHRFGAALGLSGKLGRAQKPEPRVEKARINFCATEVDADEVFRFVIRRWHKRSSRAWTRCVTIRSRTGNDLWTFKRKRQALAHTDFQSLPVLFRIEGQKERGRASG
jgi:hypothetical protein